MLKTSAKLLCCLLGVSMLVACTPSHRAVQQAFESEGISEDSTDLRTLQVLAVKQARIFMRAAGQTAVAQDLVSTGIIGAAGTATAGLLFDSHLDLVKAASLAGGSLGQLSGYYRPDTANEQLSLAAERLICIAREIERSPQFEPPQDSHAHRAVALSISSIRLSLSKGLRRQTPDYTAVYNALKNVTEVEAQVAKITQSGGPSEQDKLDMFKAEIVKCTVFTG